MNMMLRHQQVMHALRQEMGWPLTRPANDCIAWTTGRPADLAIGMELGRVATLLGKDLVYSGWLNTRAKYPAAFTLAFRTIVTVDIIERLVPYAANDDTPIVLVNTRADEHFRIDARGSLSRVVGKPTGLERGRRRAMRRIEAAAATMRNSLLVENRHVPWGTPASDIVAMSTTHVMPMTRFA